MGILVVSQCANFWSTEAPYIYHRDCYQFHVAKDAKIPFRLEVGDLNICLVQIAESF